MVVRRLSQSELIIIQLVSNWKYENETSNVNHLIVKDNKVGTKNFTRLHVGVSIANKMGGKLGKLPMTGLYSIALP